MDNQISNQKLRHQLVNGKKIIVTPFNGKKTCISCLEEKDFSEFNISLKGRCKKCFNEKYLSNKIQCICGRSYNSITKKLHYNSKHHQLQMFLLMSNFQIDSIMRC